MACQLLVSYQSFRPTGDIVAVVGADHQWGRYESLERWLAVNIYHTAENWPRKFTVVKVTDRTAEQLAYLAEKPIETGVSRYYLGVPAVGTPEYASLASTGQYECAFSEVETYLMERI